MSCSTRSEEDYIILARFGRHDLVLTGSARQSREHLVLGSQRKPADCGLDSPEPTKCGRKHEYVVRPHHVEADACHKCADFRRSGWYGISVERNSAHHVPGSWIPRVVFPKCKEATGPQSVVDVGHHSGSLIGRDVVNNPSREYEVRKLISRALFIQQELGADSRHL